MPNVIGERREVISSQLKKRRLWAMSNQADQLAQRHLPPERIAVLSLARKCVLLYASNNTSFTSDLEITPRHLSISVQLETTPQAVRDCIREFDYTYDMVWTAEGRAPEELRWWCTAMTVGGHSPEDIAVELVLPLCVVHGLMNRHKLVVASYFATSWDITPSANSDLYLLDEPSPKKKAKEKCDLNRELYQEFFIHDTESFALWTLIDLGWDIDCDDFGPCF